MWRAKSFPATGNHSGDFTRQSKHLCVGVELHGKHLSQSRKILEISAFSCSGIMSPLEGFSEWAARDWDTCKACRPFTVRAIHYDAAGRLIPTRTEYPELSSSRSAFGTLFWITFSKLISKRNTLGEIHWNNTFNPLKEKQTSKQAKKKPFEYLYTGQECSQQTPPGIHLPWIGSQWAF